MSTVTVFSEQVITILGPRNRRSPSNDIPYVNATCNDRKNWQSGLSPFVIGPAKLSDGRVSENMENAWQYSKVYKEHYDEVACRPTFAWQEWSNNGFKSKKAHRYPMGRGKKPVGSWWEEQMLGYIEARKRIYFPLYRDCVRDTKAWPRLKQIFDRNHRLQIFDYDAWDHIGSGYSLKQVLHEPTQIMGHAFVLAAMLLYGEDVAPEQLPL
jgi:hypothetical protein